MAMDKLKIAQSEKEIGNIIRLMISTNDIEGDVAEVGVYEGGTASVIYDEMKKHKKLYLFDTFHDFHGAGVNDPEWIAKLTHEIHPQLKYSYQNVMKYFDEYSNVKVFKGSFPEVVGDVLNENKFSFVHLDVDIYKPTLDSLAFFYPKMSVGGGNFDT